MFAFILILGIYLFCMGDIVKSHHAALSELDARAGCGKNVPLNKTPKRFLKPWDPA
jgi:hypothetical protein